MLDSVHSKAIARAEEDKRALVETALLEKWVKGRLAIAADHFNRDYKKGIQFLQVNTMFITPLSVCKLDGFSFHSQYT